MYKYGIALLLLLVTATARAQVFTDPATAFKAAETKDRPVLLIFQGSDWCIPCINLEQKVLSRPDFLHFSEDNIVLLKADFPQRKRLDVSLEKQYEALAELYDKEGSFPKIILLGRDRKVLRTFRVNYTQPSELVQDLEPELKKYHAEM